MREDFERRSESRAGQSAIPIFTKARGYLDGPLAASGSFGSSPTTAVMSVWKKISGTWQDTGEDITVTNRDPSLEADATAYFQAWQDGDEWVPDWAGCS